MPRPKDTASLHTPDELLAGAEAMLASADSQFARAAVLEANVALESYIHATVFDLLKEKLNPLFVKWLEQKTRYDIEARLKHITPMALEMEIDTQSKLWNRYERAKDIRNKVAHTGRRITRDEAREVLETVREWLAYLGSTAEVDLSLLGLKRYVESSGVVITKESEAVDLVRRFYEKTRPAVNVQQQVRFGNKSADMMLDFDKYSVLIETKFSDKIRIEQVLEQVNNLVLSMPVGKKEYRKVIIIFTSNTLNHEQQKVISFPDGTSGIYIKI